MLRRAPPFPLSQSSSSERPLGPEFSRGFSSRPSLGLAGTNQRPGCRLSQISPDSSRIPEKGPESEGEGEEALSWVVVDSAHPGCSLGGLSAAEQFEIDEV